MIRPRAMWQTGNSRYFVFGRANAAILYLSEREIPDPGVYG